MTGSMAEKHGRESQEGRKDGPKDGREAHEGRKAKGKSKGAILEDGGPGAAVQNLLAADYSRGIVASIWLGLRSGDGPIVCCTALAIALRGQNRCFGGG
jgi:hypothetical protein